MIMIDARYLGTALKNARDVTRLSRPVAAKLLGVGPSQLRAYERGKEIIPAFVLQRITATSFLMLRARTIIREQKHQQ